MSFVIFSTFVFLRSYRRIIGRARRSARRASSSQQPCCSLPAGCGPGRNRPEPIRNRSEPIGACLGVHFYIRVGQPGRCVMGLVEILRGMELMTDIVQIYRNYIRAAGYEESMDSHGNIIFKEREHTYYVHVNQDDPHLLRIIDPIVFEITDNNLREVLYATNVATMRTKYAKLYVRIPDWNYVSAAVDLFLLQPEHVREVLPQAIEALQASIEIFDVALQLLSRTDASAA